MAFFIKYVLSMYTMVSYKWLDDRVVIKLSRNFPRDVQNYTFQVNIGSGYAASPHRCMHIQAGSRLRHVERNWTFAAIYGWSLTHFTLGKMAVKLADDIFKCIFLNENYGIPIQNSLKLVPRSPIAITPALVQVKPSDTELWCFL